MIVALFFLPLSLVAISVGAAMLASPFMVSYVICFFFQALYQDPQNPKLPRELRMAALFLLPVLSFGITVAALVIRTQHQLRRRAAMAHKNGELLARANEYANIDPSEMFDPIVKRFRRLPPPKSMQTTKKRQSKSLFTSDDWEFSSSRRMRF